MGQGLDIHSSSGGGPAVLQGIATWMTGTSYSTDDEVVYFDGANYLIYTCLIAHTSGVFATDLGAGNWELVGASPVAPPLTDVLTSGNTTANGQVIKAENGSMQLDLRQSVNNELFLGSDPIGFTGFALYSAPSGSFGGSWLGWDNIYLKIRDNSITGAQTGQLPIFVAGVGANAQPGSSTASQANVMLSSSGSTFPANINNTVIAGGSNIQANADNALYCNELRIQSSTSAFDAIFQVPVLGADVTITAPGISGELAVTSQLYTDEDVDDRVAALIQDGTGLTWTYDDPSNTFTGNVSLGSFSTTNLSEGTNLYFTDERVDDRVAGLVIAGTGTAWTYDDVANTLKVDVSLSPFSTTNLAEGTNLYFTDERVDDRVALLIQDGTGLSWTYSDVGNTFTGNVGGLTTAEFTSANISQWTNDSNYLVNSGFTSGAVLIGSATGTVSEDPTQLFWDNPNNRLGIGTNAPDTALHVVGNITVSEDSWIGRSATTNRIIFSDSGTSEIVITNNASTRLRITGVVQDFNIGEDSVGAFSMQNSNTALGNTLRLFSGLGNGTKVVQFEVFGVGTQASVTNYERMQMRWDGISKYLITTNAGGTGVIRPLSIFTDANTDQIHLAVNGNIGLFGASTFGTTSANTLAIKSGTAPTGDVADQFALYSADIAVNHAAPHFRTENGDVIKLYKQTLTNSTGGSASTDLEDVTTLGEADPVKVNNNFTEIYTILANAGLV